MIHVNLRFQDKDGITLVATRPSNFDLWMAIRDKVPDMDLSDYEIGVFDWLTQKPAERKYKMIFEVDMLYSEWATRFDNFNSDTVRITAVAEGVQQLNDIITYEVYADRENKIITVYWKFWPSTVAVQKWMKYELNEECEWPNLIRPEEPKLVLTNQFMEHQLPFYKRIYLFWTRELGRVISNWF